MSVGRWTQRWSPPIRTGWRPRSLLYELRRRLGPTQETMGERLRIRQANISKLEHRSDPRLSTLRQYVQGMGLQLRVEAEFPDGSRVPLRLGEEDEEDLMRARVRATGVEPA